MSQRRFDIKVLAPNYSSIVGTLGTYSSCSVTWQHWGIGTGSITVPSDSDAALQLLLADVSHVPVTAKAPGYPRWTGYVSRAEQDIVPARRADGSMNNAAPITAMLTAEREWLDRILGAPVPGQPWSNQSAAEHDVRTGPIDTVLRQYVTANVNRIKATGANLPIVITPPPSPDLSPVVTIEVRNKTLREELDAAQREHGRDITVELWLPGDPQPSGLSLTAPTLVVGVSVSRAKQYVNFTDTVGGLVGGKLVVVRPKATAVAVGGPGEGTARVFNYVVADDGRVEALGPQGYTEVFLDATDADSGDLRISRGKDKLAELAGKVAIEVEIDDRRPWIAGPTADYWVGDLVRGTFSRVSVTDYIDRLTVTSNASGFTVTPQFGASRETESADVALARAVARYRTEQTNTQARR